MLLWVVIIFLVSLVGPAVWERIMGPKKRSLTPEQRANLELQKAVLDWAKEIFNGMVVQKSLRHDLNLFMRQHNVTELPHWAMGEKREHRQSSMTNLLDQAIQEAMLFVESRDPGLGPALTVAEWAVLGMAIREGYNTEPESTKYTKLAPAVVAMYLKNTPQPITRRPPQEEYDWLRAYMDPSKKTDGNTNVADKVSAAKLV